MKVRHKKFMIYIWFNSKKHAYSIGGFIGCMWTVVFSDLTRTEPITALI